LRSVRISVLPCLRLISPFLSRCRVSISNQGSFERVAPAVARGWGLADRPGPGAAIRGAPILQTNNRVAGSKVRDVRQFGPSPTLGELQRTTPWVWLWCERCQHHAPLACAVAVILWGPEASSDRLRAGARCTSCGRKGATIQRPGWAGNHIGFYPFPKALPMEMPKHH
jgi:hypothetical protein